MMQNVPPVVKVKPAKTNLTQESRENDLRNAPMTPFFGFSTVPYFSVQQVYGSIAANRRPPVAPDSDNNCYADKYNEKHDGSKAACTPCTYEQCGTVDEARALVSDSELTRGTVQTPFQKHTAAVSSNETRQMINKLKVEVLMDALKSPVLRDLKKDVPKVKNNTVANQQYPHNSNYFFNEMQSRNKQNIKEARASDRSVKMSTDVEENVNYEAIEAGMGSLLLNDTNTTGRPATNTTGTIKKAVNCKPNQGSLLTLPDEKKFRRFRKNRNINKSRKVNAATSPLRYIKRSKVNVGTSPIQFIESSGKSIATSPLRIKKALNVNASGRNNSKGMKGLAGPNPLTVAPVYSAPPKVVHTVSTNTPTWPIEPGQDKKCNCAPTLKRVTDMFRKVNDEMQRRLITTTAHNHFMVMCESFIRKTPTKSITFKDMLVIHFDMMDRLNKLNIIFNNYKNITAWSPEFEKKIKEILSEYHLIDPMFRTQSAAFTELIQSALLQCQDADTSTQTSPRWSLQLIKQLLNNLLQVLRGGNPVPMDIDNTQTGKNYE